MPRTAGARQDFNDLRPVLAPKAATISVLSPNGDEALTSGKVVTIQWQSTGITENVLVEFSLDDGFSWTAVYPAERRQHGPVQMARPARGFEPGAGSGLQLESAGGLRRQR